MIDVPAPLQRLYDEVDGWLDLRCPDRALDRLQPLLDDPAARPAGLLLRIRAQVRLGDLGSTLPDLDELRRAGQLVDWVDLTEAWCRKRLHDLPGAIQCAERVVTREPKSDLAHFNLACYLALAGDHDRAIDELTLACGIAEACRDHARDEPDFDGLRKDPRFRQLLREARPAPPAPLGGTTPPPLDDDDGLEGDVDDDDDDDDRPPAPGLN